MFEWLFKIDKPTEDTNTELTRLKTVIAALETSLVEKDDKLLHHLQRGQQTLAAVLLASGGQVHVSNDILDVVTSTEFEMNVESDSDGLILSLLLVEPKETV